MIFEVGALELSDDHEKPDSATPLDPAPNPAEPLVEVAGRVKWFDVGKGYGFIVPDDGGGDVLIHVTVLRRDGFTTLSEGARVVAEAQRRDRGLQVLKVHSVTPGDPAANVSDSQARQRAQATQIGSFEIVIVKWFNRSRGFGFLTRGEGTEDIFVHMETLAPLRLHRPQAGRHACSRASGPGPKGLLAVEVRPLEAGRAQVAH